MTASLSTTAPAAPLDGPPSGRPSAAARGRSGALTVDERLLRAAVLYALLGVAMGVAMAGSHDFTNKGVHVHVNLLGWVSMALMAFAYRQFPRMGRSVLARLHFWLHTVGLPVMVAGLYALLHQVSWGEPVVAVGSIAVALAFACFALNVWRHGDAQDQRAQEAA